MVSGSSTISIESAFEAYADDLSRIAGIYERDHDLAEEFVSQVWETAYKSWWTFDGANTVGWLRTILRNIIRMHYRCKSNQLNDGCVSLDQYLRHHNVNLLDPNALTDPQKMPRALVDDGADLDYALACLDQGEVLHSFHQLPKGQREALRLSIEKVPQREAAATLGISETAYRQSVFKARRQLRGILAREQA